MSVGIFMGIRASYANQAQDAASSFLDAINRALGTADLPLYIDPESPCDVYDGYYFGRSALDHHHASCMSRLAELSTPTSRSPHLQLLGWNPYRTAFLPFVFEKPLETDYSERIAGSSFPIWIGSSPRLHAELQALALVLGIPLRDGALDDQVAQRINAFEPLFDVDDCSLAEDERTAWLLLFEGTRLSVVHNVALSLAG
jgi:hypothetical protein